MDSNEKQWKKAKSYPHNEKEEEAQRLLFYVPSLIAILPATPSIDSICSTSVIAITNSRGKYGIEDKAQREEDALPSRRMNRFGGGQILIPHPLLSSPSSVSPMHTSGGS
jgi:hypothetical protein